MNLWPRKFTANLLSDLIFC